MKDINIYGTLVSMTTDQKLALTKQIFDSVQNEFQEPINQRVFEQLQSITSKLDSLQGDVESSGGDYETLKRMIEALNSFDLEVIEDFPSTPKDHTLYLKRKDGDSGDVFDEYLYIENKWELIGSVGGVNIDLSNYYTKGEVDSKLSSAGNGNVMADNTLSEDYLIVGSGNKTIKSSTVKASDITNKIDKGSLATVNGQSLENGGNIQIQSGESVDLSDYYTKGEVDDKIAGAGGGDVMANGELVSNKLVIAHSAKSIKTSDKSIDDLVTSDMLDSKQDKLVSGTNIKTINGESLLGEGNITIQGGSGDCVCDLDDYYTKGEVDSKISNAGGGNVIANDNLAEGNVVIGGNNKNIVDSGINANNLVQSDYPFEGIYLLAGDTGTKKIIEFPIEIDNLVHTNNVTGIVASTVRKTKCVSMDSLTDEVEEYLTAKSFIKTSGVVNMNASSSSEIDLYSRIVYVDAQDKTIKSSVAVVTVDSSFNLRFKNIEFNPMYNQYLPNKFTCFVGLINTESHFKGTLNASVPITIDSRDYSVNETGRDSIYVAVDFVANGYRDLGSDLKAITFVCEEIRILSQKITQVVEGGNSNPDVEVSEDDVLDILDQSDIWLPTITTTAKSNGVEMEFEYDINGNVRTRYGNIPAATTDKYGVVKLEQNIVHNHSIVNQTLSIGSRGVQGNNICGVSLALDTVSINPTNAVNCNSGKCNISDISARITTDAFNKELGILPETTITIADCADIFMPDTVIFNVSYTRSNFGPTYILPTSESRQWSYLGPYKTFTIGLIYKLSSNSTSSSKKYDYSGFINYNGNSQEQNVDTPGYPGVFVTTSNAPRTISDVYLSQHEKEATIIVPYNCDVLFDNDTYKVVSGMYDIDPSSGYKVYCLKWINNNIVLVNCAAYE